MTASASLADLTPSPVPTWCSWNEATAARPSRRQLGSLLTTAALGLLGLAVGVAAVLPGSRGAAASPAVSVEAPPHVGRADGDLPLIEHPVRVAQRWRLSQQSMDRSAYGALLGPGFSTATERGRIDGAAWTAHRFEALADREAYDAQVLDVHPAGINWPDDPEAIEVELLETWVGSSPMRGRARITLVRGRIVDVAHWGARAHDPAFSEP